MPKISKEYQDNIKNYAKQIKTLPFLKAVRKTPGQYIGYVGNPGHINMIRELLQNGLDEIQKDDSPCTRVIVSYYEKERMCIVQDNGRGIPHGHMFRIYTNSNTSSNYEKKAREFSAGRHGVGAKVTNALSTMFKSTSYMCSDVTGGKAIAHTIEFHEGEVWDKGDSVTYELEVGNPENMQGTIVMFTPSIEIMGEITTTCDDVMELISMLLPLMKIGAIVDFHGEKANGEIIDKHIVNEDGILTYLICDMHKSSNIIIAPIVISDIHDDMKTDIAFTYDSSNLGEETIRSFANTCPTINTAQSSHVSGFLDALTAYFRKYMNSVYLGKNSKLQVQSVDIRSGLNAVVTVSHLFPHFSGQAKEIFSNKDVIPFIKNAMFRDLDEWIKNNPGDVQKLCKYFKDVADLRVKADKDKANFVVKHKSVLDGLPAKYEKPTGSKDLEFIIVEGDSAMSSARRARDPKKQGLLPIRGKIINAMTTAKAEYFKNEEAKGIRAILDSGEGSTFDINRCKFSKIILMGDADIDGAHIRELLLKTFLVYYRPLIEAGRIYAAQPPLYGAKIGGKMIYFTDKKAYIDYVLNGFSKDTEVLDSSGKKMSKEALRHLLYINSNYTAELKPLSTTYAINPYLLELMLSIKDLSLSKIKQTVKKFDRYLDVTDRNGSLVLEGLYNDKIHTVIFNDLMIDHCKRIVKYLEASPDKVYTVNGVQMSLFGLMCLYEKYQPSNVKRFKGLGEMNPSELQESTLHPDYNRHLIRFTTDNIKKEIQAIREIESNKSLLLKGVDIAGYDL